MVNTLFFLLFLHLHSESLCRLECGDVVLGNDDGSILRDVTSGLLGSLLQDEATKTTEVYILFLNQRLLNYFHESLYALKGLSSVDTCLLADLANNF